MPKKSTRNARGAGSIHKKTVVRNGRQYIYWEGRITTGRDPGTGKQIQKSFTGKTQKEVREKMQAAAVAVNNRTYLEPSKMTVGGWLDVWSTEYLGGVKPGTAEIYRRNVSLHIKPAIGAIRLVELRPHIVQKFINEMELAPASVHLAYRTLHTALEKAVELDYIPKNPAYKCVLPKRAPREVHPLEDEQTAALLNAVKGGELEYFISIALFTGMRLSEMLGLTWDAVDFDSGTITINKQLAQIGHRKNGLFSTPKSGKSRIITPATSVLSTLKRQRIRQAEMQLQAGPTWSNPHGLVFTGPTGKPLEHRGTEKAIRRVLDSAGLEGYHFHDIRHTYAVNSIRAGDDIKTVQQNLGHHTAAFTLDVYGHTTERMKLDSAARMERFMRDVLNL